MASVSSGRAFSALERLYELLAIWTRAGEPVVKFWYSVVAKALRKVSDEPMPVATYDGKSNTLQTNMVDDEFSAGVLSVMVPLVPVAFGVYVLELVDYFPTGSETIWPWVQLAVIMAAAAVMVSAVCDFPTESGGFRIEPIDGGDG